MSYEGYSQFLCKKGHYWAKDCYVLIWLEPKEYPKCPICKGKHVWENMVNTTNGSFDDKGDRIDGYVKLKIKLETSGICSQCGKKHICETTYKIPIKEEVNKK